jgi:hypothetical protein
MERHDHAAGEHAGLLDLIVAQRIGLDVHGLVAIGFFSLCHAQGARQGEEHKEGGNAMFHEGTNLAIIVAMHCTP